jgi:tRNA threonylcarbamoyladenosine biosynthesis protein TsaE
MPIRTLSIPLPGEAETAALGERLARHARPGDVIALQGDLGAGKTTLARALIRRLAGSETEAPSPTFTLVQTYETAQLSIWHFDLYRLNDPREARELGMEEAVDGLCLIEWPERLGRDLPSARLEVRLSFDGEGRIAQLQDLHDWSTRLDGDWRPTP